MASPRKPEADSAKPSGDRDFFHIEVRPKSEFNAFRSQDEKGGIERVAGQRAGGDWETHEWLISKRHAHVENGRLVADTDDARRVLDDLDSVPEQVEGDRFRAKPRRSGPKINIAKARATRKK
jgi:hypothetical protein